MNNGTILVDQTITARQQTIIHTEFQRKARTDDRFRTVRTKSETICKAIAPRPISPQYGHRPLNRNEASIDAPKSNDPRRRIFD